MQIQTGSAAVVNASAIVTASAGNDWSQATVASLFKVPGDGVLYGITAVRTPAQNASERWELTLSVPYGGDSSATSAYAISKDFTPSLGLPIMGDGDVETILLVNRGFKILDSLVSAAGGNRTGMQALGSGVESVAVVFASAMEDVPANIVVSLGVPSGGAGFLVWVDQSTITAAGFTARFGAATPDANFKLHYEAHVEGPQNGLSALGSGVESVAVVFEAPMSSVPANIVVSLGVPSGGAGFLVWVDQSTITAAGFTARFGAATPDANFKLHYQTT